MDRRARIGLVAAVGAAAAILLSACSPTTTVTSTSEAPRTVAVTSTGTADVAPDAARAQVSVVTTDPSSATAAQQSAAAAGEKVLAALTSAGVAAEDISTTGISVGPTYNYTSDGGQVQTGYQATQTLTVTLRDLATAGGTIDAAVAAGGNAVRVDSVSTFVTDPSAAVAKARAQAVDVATKQAQQYASLLGFTLGPVASVSESSGTVVPPVPMAMADEAAGAPKVQTTITPGTTQVSVSLSVSWVIE